MTEQNENPRKMMWKKVDPELLLDHDEQEGKQHSHREKPRNSMQEEDSRLMQDEEK